MSAIRRTYLDTSWGQVHALCAGERGPRIALFHESPLSAEVYVEVLEALAPHARAVALDTPGYGASSPPDGPGHEIEEYAAVLAEALAGLGADPVVAGGVHTGASLAIEIARRAEVPTAGVFLSGVALFDDEERASFVSGWTPPVPTDVDGAQFHWAIERYQRIWPELTPELLHTAVVQVLRVKDRYDWGYQAAFRHDPAGPLAELDVPVLLLDAEHDMLARFDARALELARDVRLEVLDGLPGQPHLRAPDDYARHLVDFATRCIPSHTGGAS